jgi:uncharacterized UBP type Zn finger protein
MTEFVKTNYFLTYPKVLVVILQRFVFNDWVPKKLMIELQVDTNQPINLEVYRGQEGATSNGEYLFKEDV